MIRALPAATLALLCATVARGDERLLTEAQAPRALFGPDAAGTPGLLRLSGPELDELSRRVGRRVTLRDYRYLDVHRETGRDGGAATPLGVIVFLSVMGQNLPIDFAVGVRPDGTLQDIQLLVYREPYGKEIDERRFRRQFAGKTARDPLVVGKDIDAISGASISSIAAAYAAKKGLALAEILRRRVR